MSSYLLLAAMVSVPTVPVAVGTSPGLSAFAMEVAKKEVHAIYEHSRVAVEWNDASETSRPSRPSRPSRNVQIVVLFREAESFPVKTEPRALGLALLSPDAEAPRTRVLVIFRDRLERLVGCNCPVPMGRALGRAIAHEIGHSVKYEPRHSERGLMRAEIPRIRWGAPHRADFHFDDADAEAIRDRLSRPRN